MPAPKKYPDEMRDRAIRLVADIAEDLSAVCAALKAQVVIQAPSGNRTVGMDGFYIGPLFVHAYGPHARKTNRKSHSSRRHWTSSHNAWESQRRS